jgi:hypothetical protein
MDMNTAPLIPFASRSSEVAQALAQQRTYWWIVGLLSAIIFEGALRKWFLPLELRPLAYVAKDVVGFLFVVTHPIPRRLWPVCKSRAFFAVVAVVLLIPLFQGLEKNAAPAFLIYKNAVLWPVIAFHVAASLDSEILTRLIRLLTPITVGMAALGVLQFGSSPSAFLNRYAWDSYDASITFGANASVRATGTFSFISGLSTYAVIVFTLLLWRLLSMKEPRERRFLTVGIAAAVFCGLVTGTRYIAVAMGLSTALTLAAARSFKTLIRLSVAGAVLALALNFVSGGGVLDAFVGRWQNAGDSLVDRITGRTLSADYGELLGDHPFGVGLGQTNPIAQQAGSDVVYYDHGISNLVVEGGYLGLTGLLLTAIVCVSMLIEGYSSKYAPFRLGVYAVALVTFYTLLNLPWGDHVGTALRWFSIALWFSTNPRFLAAAPAIEPAEVQFELSESTP